MRRLDAIIADLERFNSVSELFELFEWLDAKVQRSGLASLTEPGRAIFLVQLYDGGMFRGGFDTLFRWEPRLGVMPMIAALEQVGAQKTAAVLANLASMFPSGAIPNNAELRCREYYDHVLTREQDLERVYGKLDLAESEEDVCLLCLEYARSKSIDLLAEASDLGTGTTPDP